MRNTGKTSEALFEASIDALGKAGYWYRITDAAAVRGLTGRVGQGMHATPSDYIISVRGVVHFAEVKSTNDQFKFAFNLLKKGQKAHGKRIVASGGLYQVYIHRLRTDDWYSLPLSFIHSTQDAGRQSLTWEEMEQFKWNKRHSSSPA